MKQLDLSREDLKAGGRWGRIGKVFGIPLLMFIAFCFVPVNTDVRRHSAVEVANAQVVRPASAGFIREVHVKEGQHVQEGAVLAELENREIRQELAIQERALEEYELRIRFALGSERADEVKQLEALRDGAKARLEKARRDVEQLTLRAKSSGVVLNRDLETRAGQLLRPPNDTFCEIAPLNPMQIKIPLTEQQVREVRRGQGVTLLADAFPSKKFQGVVKGDAMELDEHNFPMAFSKSRGGDVPTVPDGMGREKLLEHTYVVTVEVQNPENLLRYGMTARAKIDTGKRPFGKIVLQWCVDLISLDYRF